MSQEYQGSWTTNQDGDLKDKAIILECDFRLCLEEQIIEGHLKNIFGAVTKIKGIQFQSMISSSQLQVTLKSKEANRYHFALWTTMKPASQDEYQFTQIKQNIMCSVGGFQK